MKLNIMTSKEQESSVWEALYELVQVFSEIEKERVKYSENIN